MTSDADLGPLLESAPPETDPDLLRRLRHMYEAGGWVLLESAIADLPADLRWLFESGAVTLEQLVELHRTLNLTSAADIGAAVHASAVRALPGFDERIETAIAEALPMLRAAVPRIPLGRAHSIADPIISSLRDVPGVEWAMPAGSMRRGQETVGDIEIVVSGADPAAALDAAAAAAGGSRVLHRGAQRLYVLADRVQVGVRCLPPANAGAALLHLTGSPAHLAGLRALASERGARLDPSGLTVTGSAAPIADTEEAIYAALGLPPVPPEIRDGDQELAAARAGSLPRLIAREDIRGDLHMHTTWSDGRDSTARMVEACAALGYEYLAITDHSPHSGATRSLTPDTVARQADEIAELRQRYPALTLLHGCEVDIMPDGRLDFADRILERFDIVLASLHQRDGQSREQLIKRYQAAMRHPLVTLITHPTNRLVPTRPGYDLDYDRLFETAVETGTLVEIDGAPSHLDLDGALARRAVAAGAIVAIDSDCHRADMLERQMAFGIATARRGWIEPHHVLNTRPIDDVRRVIAAKRGR